ncbi:MAG: outer membrane insertion C- signal [Flavobacterium sp.]|nr:MAG: outer membrane insertion C- signal [Flavobacterium sp.]
MKKLLLGLFFMGSIHFATAQEIGVRFGDVTGNDVAVDAVFSAGKFSRIHADVSFGNGGVGVEALYDFIYRPLGGESFNWYLGVGPSAFIGDDFLLGASGEIGLEYKFKGAPIALGLDWRPTLWIVEDTDFHAGGFGLNLRYVF